MTQYGKFHDFCRDSGNRYSTIPVCNLFDQSPTRTNPAPGWGGCDLSGISLSNNRHLANLGSILISFSAILISLYLFLQSHRKKAAVGRREMQLFLLGYALISLCEIFTVGGIPLNGKVTRGFSALHVASVVSTTWILLMNAIVGFQLVDDGTAVSVGGILGSAAVLFIGSGYVALDTGFSWTHYFKNSIEGDNLSYWLYTLYLLLPLLCLAFYFLLETFLVIKILKERRPLYFLLTTLFLFVVAQVFQFLASPHICTGTNGNINGGFFDVLFTLASVVMVWVFWSSITEDDWVSEYGAN